MSDCMVASESWVETYGGKDSLVPRVRYQEVGDDFDLLSDPPVDAHNGLKAKQEHCRFGDNLTPKKPSDILSQSSGLDVRRFRLSDRFDHLSPYIEGVDDSPKQVRLAPPSY